MTPPMKSYGIAPTMQEDGLHGIDGFHVLDPDGAVVDDSFSSDRDDAQGYADELNEEMTSDGP